MWDLIQTWGNHIAQLPQQTSVILFMGHLVIACGILYMAVISVLYSVKAIYRILYGLFRDNFIIVSLNIVLLASTIILGIATIYLALGFIQMNTPP